MHAAINTEANKNTPANNYPGYNRGNLDSEIILRIANGQSPAKQRGFLVQQAL